MAATSARNRVEDAGWYHIDALPTIPAQLSVAYQLIRHTSRLAAPASRSTQLKYQREPLAPFSDY
jgi:RNase adaptor protein for sRNA GlmZ degradation